MSRRATAMKHMARHNSPEQIRPNIKDDIALVHVCLVAHMQSEVNKKMYKVSREISAEGRFSFAFSALISYCGLLLLHKTSVETDGFKRNLTLLLLLKVTLSISLSREAYNGQNWLIEVLLPSDICENTFWKRRCCLYNRSPTVILQS
uniref:Uncharacterized protein n=1 Tax=Odontella aurita TaxID=265563 RepID=A0A7S4M7C9_9STRA